MSPYSRTPSYEGLAPLLKFLILAALCLSLVTLESYGQSRSNASLLTAASAVQQAETEYNVGPVAVVEAGGALMPEEKELLLRLSEEMIPLPDSIVVVDQSPTGRWRGWVPLWRPMSVYLTGSRRTDPAVFKSKYPYLLGREMPTNGKVPAYVQVLAHEIGHVIEPKLLAEYGRPALGVQAMTQEIEAEIIGYVLMRIAFGTVREELGFPAMIEYQAPGLRDKPVELLRRQYCQMIKGTWQLTHLSCEGTTAELSPGGSSFRTTPSE